MLDGRMAAMTAPGMAARKAASSAVPMDWKTAAETAVPKAVVLAGPKAASWDGYLAAYWAVTSAAR